MGCSTNEDILKAWDPPFFKAGPREEVEMLPGEVTGIIMNEEIEAPIIVAIVTGYTGNTKPEFGNFVTGSNINLGLDFELIDNEWNMIVNNKQDYEQAGMQRYNFEVQIDAKRISVQIAIMNIFDNPPVVTALSNPCSIEELRDPPYNTGCLFVSFSESKDLRNANKFLFFL